MSKIFAYISITCLIVGLFFDRVQVMTEAVLLMPLNVFDLTIRIIVNACLWNGFLALANASGLIHRLCQWLLPFFKFIYPDLNKNDEVMGLLASNFIANFIGLGSLAMISGLKAMKALDEANDFNEKASRSMKTLIIFNTTGCSLFPMSIITMRSAYHSEDPLGFIGWTFLIGLITLICGLLIQKGVEHFE